MQTEFNFSYRYVYPFSVPPIGLAMITIVVDPRPCQDIRSDPDVGFKYLLLTILRLFQEKACRSKHYNYLSKVKFLLYNKLLLIQITVYS